MPKSTNDKKENKSLACCLVNPPSNSPSYQRFSSPSDYQTTPPSTPLDSPPPTPIAPLGFSPSELLTTPKTTPLPLTYPPPTPTQPSKQSSPLTINIEPVELILSTPPTSLHPFFDSLEDLPPRTTNPPPQPTFDSIECLVNHPLSVPEIMKMEPPLPPLPPQLLPLSQSMWSNDILPPLTHKTFYQHCLRTQVIINDFRNKMRFILNHILDRLTTLTHQNFP
ncbi:hypothetical protein Tco_1329349 [Tanacetum coccineum]